MKFQKTSLISHLSRLALIYILFIMAVPLLARPSKLMERIFLVPSPKKLVYANDMVSFPPSISVIGLDRKNGENSGTIATLESLFSFIPEIETDYGGTHAYKISFEHSPDIQNHEGYRLISHTGGIIIKYATKAGQFYGAQTVYQLLAYAYHGHRFVYYPQKMAELEADTKRYIPLLTIEDEPAYKIRSVMLDLGRAPHGVALIKRVIRIMGQLKLNTLHLHLYDDQLCGFRFKNLPLGGENPFAIDADDLKELVRYARMHHIAIIPELESWGHVKSVLFHYPELTGSGGARYRAASFAVGEKTYALLEKIYDEIIPCLETNASVHVGLDEAIWKVLPGEESKGHTPTNMIGRIYDILMRVAARHGKKITMHLWADHEGRPLPKEIEDKVVIEPWHYLESDKDSIIKTLQKYGGPGKTPVMMGAGANSLAFGGAYEATRIWCQEGMNYPNILGVTLCIWESNDISGHAITLYCGADYAWTPATPARAKNDLLGERLRDAKNLEVRKWQILFPDADANAIDIDRGPAVHTGRYCWLPFAGKPVAPTVNFAVP